MTRGPRHPSWLAARRPIGSALAFRAYVAAKRRAVEARADLASAVEADPEMNDLETAIGQAGIDLDEAQADAVSAARGLKTSICGEREELE
jgi:hypothetical protein